MEKFWMVIGKSSPSTSHRHDTLESAKTEAERLCHQHGCTFVVLSAIDVVEYPKVSLEWKKTTTPKKFELPFE